MGKNMIVHRRKSVPVIELLGSSYYVTTSGPIYEKVGSTKIYVSGLI